MTNNGAVIRLAWGSGERSISRSASASGSPIHRVIRGREWGGTAAAKVTRLDGPTTLTPAAQYSGSRDRHDSAAKPPYEAPNTAIRAVSAQGMVARYLAAC